ncbi:hypothetical protein TNCT_271881 [Trichonephila clavata]|uniref:Uncharacterized protein n=1 Tax=Trichonephila clavata TaxID=2740835 RepID=A0A8X6FAP4_TRICU|nr:hypothetical protein TNCT_271881 [Trichonephila clavata]
MDEEEDEITAFKILLELADSMFWLAVVLDAMFTFYNKIPLYIPVLFIIIQLFIRFQITAGIPFQRHVLLLVIAYQTLIGKLGVAF